MKLKDDKRRLIIKGKEGKDYPKLALNRLCISCGPWHINCWSKFVLKILHITLQLSFG